MVYDVAVIGGGVIGGTILRELSKYTLKVCLLEKESDVCSGQSKANSGIVHAGFDAVTGTLKAKFNILGNRMMQDYANELGVNFKKNGSLVVAYSKEQMKALYELKERGETNGVDGLEIIDKDALLRLEPNLSEDAVAALYAPTGGIICPYGLTVAAIGNAMDNGAELKTDFKVDRVCNEKDYALLYSQKGDEVKAKLVINCAGLFGGEVAALFGEKINIKGRKGEYILLDRESGGFVSRTIFSTPTERGKGILISPTVDGNIILGPTAEETADTSPYTTAGGLNSVQEKAKEMSKEPPIHTAITSFAGIRAFSDKNDFVIEYSKVNGRLINCVGIESPGLTASPAIAKFVVEELVSKTHKLCARQDFNNKRQPMDFFSRLTQEEKNEIIKKDKSFGRIVCRCEKITEGEIINALRQNPKVKTVDGVKRRIRAGMGRCQGGFCQVRVAELIASELGVPFETVTKKGGRSVLTVGKRK